MVDLVKIRYEIEWQQFNQILTHLEYCLENLGIALDNQETRKKFLVDVFCIFSIKYNKCFCLVRADS